MAVQTQPLYDAENTLSNARNVCVFLERVNVVKEEPNVHTDPAKSKTNFFTAFGRMRDIFFVE